MTETTVHASTGDQVAQYGAAVADIIEGATASAVELDLTDLSADELKKLAAELTRAADKRQQQEAAAFAARIRAEIKAAGYTPEQLGFATTEREPVRAAKATRRPAPAKYRNPADPSQTWTGRGKPTRWFVAALAAGHTRESMLIGGAEGGAA